MKIRPEVAKAARARLAAMEREDEAEWAFVRGRLLRAAASGVPSLAYDDRAWDLWFRFRGDLPQGWCSEWSAACAKHVERFSSSPSAHRERAIALGRLELAQEYDPCEKDKGDLATLRSELYLIADLALDLGRVTP